MRGEREMTAKLNAAHLTFDKVSQVKKVAPAISNPRATHPQEQLRRPGHPVLPVTSDNYIAWWSGSPFPHADVCGRVARRCVLPRTGDPH